MALPVLPLALRQPRKSHGNCRMILRIVKMKAAAASIYGTITATIPSVSTTIRLFIALLPLSPIVGIEYVVMFRCPLCVAARRDNDRCWFYERCRNHIRWSWLGSVVRLRRSIVIGCMGCRNQ
jgi:hypothetical protein